MRNCRVAGALLLLAALTIIPLCNIATGQDPNSPPEVDIGGPYFGVEGTPVNFDASGTTDADGDTLIYNWDFDDDGDFDNTDTSIPTATYTWRNEYSGYVTLNVSDSTHFVEVRTMINISNAPPEVTSVTEMTVNEGDPINLTATATDPGILDPLYTVFQMNKEYDLVTYLGYAPGSSTTTELECPPNPWIPPTITLIEVEYGSVTLTCEIDTEMYHIKTMDFYQHAGTITGEDIPVGFTKSTYTLTHPWPIEVVRYDFNPVLNPHTVFEFEIYMEAEDIEIFDEIVEVWCLQWHLIDTSNDVVGAGVMTNNTNITIPYKGDWIPDDCIFDQLILNISTYDDLGLFDFHIIIINVNNVAPSVEINETDMDTEFEIDETISFSGMFSDPGWLDSHTIIWDFGDGTNATGSLEAEHKYDEAGTYEVKLTVTDDDGGVGVDTFTIEIKDEGGISWIIILIVIIVVVLVIIGIALFVFKIGPFKPKT